MRSLTDGVVMKIFCEVCWKQALDKEVSVYDEYCTTLIGARCGFYFNNCICGHCAKDLDEDGLFPDERS